MLRRRSAGGPRTPISALSLTDTDDFTTSGTSDTRINLNYGSQDPGKLRYVVVYLGMTTSWSGTITGMTIFGETGTELVTERDGFAKLHIWQAFVPTGSTGSITINYSSSNTSNAHLAIATYQVDPFAVPEVVGTDTTVAPASGNGQMSVSATKNGLIIAASSVVDGSTSTWTNATEILDVDHNTGEYVSLAYLQVTATGTENIDCQNADTTPLDMCTAVVSIF